MADSLLDHVLLGSYPENIHVLNKQGKAAVNKDKELCPGDQSCAVCAVEAGTDEELISCPQCRRVQYCGSAHAKRDALQHGVVCGALAAMAASEEVALTTEAESDLLTEWITYITPPQTLLAAKGWRDLILSQHEGQDNKTNTERPSKRIRTSEFEICDDGDDGQPSTSQVQRGTPPATPAPAVKADAPDDEEEEGEEEEGSEEDTGPYDSDDDDDDDDDESEGGEEEEEGADQVKEAVSKTAILSDPEARRKLQEAIKVCTASYYLSYPATLAHALASVGDGDDSCDGSCDGVHPLAEVVESLGEGRALVVAVLGASDDAELAHVDVWKVLSGLVPGGIVLQMVGPEVSASRHMQVITVCTGVRLAFFKGEYTALVDHVMVAGPQAAFPSLASCSPLGTSTLPRTEPTSPPPPPPAPNPPSKSPAAGGGGGGSSAASSPLGQPGSVRRVRVLPEELCALPHALMGYNLGLTCPDYGWSTTLHAVKRVFQARCDAVKHSGQEGKVEVTLPWMLTSNTQVEAVLEEEVVLGCGWSVALETRRNPWGSLELLQSGTLANDLYRKSTWVATYQLTAEVKCRPGAMVKAADGGGGGGRRVRRSLGHRLRGWATGVVGAILGRKRSREEEGGQ